jgi:hypothetical protein
MAAFIVAIALVVGAVLLVGRLIQDHIYANKWREVCKLIKMNQTQVPVVSTAAIAAVDDRPAWLLTFKDGGKPKTIRIPAKDESEAMGNAIRSYGVNSDRIISLMKE